MKSQLTKVSSLLARIARITRSCIIYKTYNFNVDYKKSVILYQKFPSKTKRVLELIDTDLLMSQEYVYKDVIRCFVLYYLQKGEELDIYDLDYQLLKKNFKLINKIFNKGYYMPLLKNIIKDIELKKYSILNILTINDSGTSILYDMCKNNYPISVAVYFNRLFKLNNKKETNESQSHFRFRKSLRLLEVISEL